MHVLDLSLIAQITPLSPIENHQIILTNSFGRLLIDFLQTLDMCTLNGRFDPLKDGFTSVSTKGLAVVDYCLVPLQHFSAFSKFNVVDIHDFVHSKDIAVDSKIPDHRLIA